MNLWKLERSLHNSEKAPPSPHHHHGPGCRSTHAALRRPPAAPLESSAPRPPAPATTARGHSRLPRGNRYWGKRPSLQKLAGPHSRRHSSPGATNTPRSKEAQKQQRPMICPHSFLPKKERLCANLNTTFKTPSFWLNWVIKCHQPSTEFFYLQTSS